VKRAIVPDYKLNVEVSEMISTTQHPASEEATQVLNETSMMNDSTIVSRESVEKTPNTESQDPKNVLVLEGKRYISVVQMIKIVQQRKNTVVSESWLRNLTKSGEIEAYRIIGRRGIWIPEEAFENYFEKTGFKPQLIPVATKKVD